MGNTFDEWRQITFDVPRKTHRSVFGFPRESSASSTPPRLTRVSHLPADNVNARRVHFYFRGGHLFFCSFPSSSSSRSTSQQVNKAVLSKKPPPPRKKKLPGHSSGYHLPMTAVQKRLSFFFARVCLSLSHTHSFNFPSALSLSAASSHHTRSPVPFCTWSTPA